MSVTFYDSFEEMMDDLGKAMKEADSQVKPWQAEIKVGDCFRQDTEYGFPIFGKVLETYEEERMQHYRLTFAFSEACPQGELGDVHISVITAKIDEATFNAMWEKLNPGQGLPSYGD